MREYYWLPLATIFLIFTTTCSKGGSPSLPAGSEGGPCYGNGSCDAGLICNQDNICEQASGDPCEGETCSGYGTCSVIAGNTPTCICDPGYHDEGLECVENDPNDPCDGVTCSEHGSCVDNNGTPECNCDPGYHAVGLACIEDDVCAGVTCSGHGTCYDDNGLPACNCDQGYHAEGLNCVEDPDSCAGVTCSGHGNCVDNNGTPECRCDPGYYVNGLNCVADCVPNGGACSSDGVCCSNICGTDADNDSYFSQLLGHHGTCHATSHPYTDCCDSDFLVHPGQTAYFTSPNWCSNYDYNCNGNEEKNADCTYQTLAYQSGTVVCYDNAECSGTGYTYVQDCALGGSNTSNCGGSAENWNCNCSTCHYGINPSDGLGCVYQHPVCDVWSTTVTCGCK